MVAVRRSGGALGLFEKNVWLVLRPGFANDFLLCFVICLVLLFLKTRSSVLGLRPYLKTPTNSKLVSVPFKQTTTYHLP